MEELAYINQTYSFISDLIKKTAFSISDGFNLLNNLSFGTDKANIVGYLEGKMDIHLIFLLKEFIL